MATKIADQYAEIAAGMKRLGLSRDVVEARTPYTYDPERKLYCRNCGQSSASLINRFCPNCGPQ